MKMRSATRIAFVSNTSWSLYNFRIDVLRSLISFGIDVYVLAPRDEYSVKLISEGTTFIPLPLNNHSTNPFSDLKLSLYLIRVYRKYKFDHIFHYTIKPNIYGSIAARLCRRSSTAITTGLGRMFEFKNPLVNRVSQWLYKLAGRCTSEMWFLNERDRQVFLSKGLIKKNKSFLLPSEGVNCSKFKPFNKKKITPITRFLFAGRLLRNKGIEEFVSAARLIKENHRKVRFEVLGFLDERNKNSITRKELSHWHKKGFIKYLGATEDVRPFIDRCDCVVFPSYYQEGVSRILLEASSMAKPIIAASTEGCIQVVEHGVNGFLCKPKSVDDLVIVINKFLKLPVDQRKVLGQNGRQKMLSQFEVGQIIDIYFSRLREYCRPPELATINTSTIKPLLQSPAS